MNFSPDSCYAFSYMVKVTGLSVPDPLLNAYFKTLTSKNSFGIDNVGLKLPSQNWTRAKRTANRSLFLYLAPTWETFLSDRRTAWQAYWIALGHSFELTTAGWPGSGFSAFVEVNAPRIKLGEDLLLDPPATAIILNGGFDGSLDPWYAFAPIDSGEGFSWGAVWADGQVTWHADDFTEGDDESISQNYYAFTNDVTYHVALDLAVSSDASVYLPLFMRIGISAGFDGYAEFDTHDIYANGLVLTHYEFDIVAFDDPDGEGSAFFFIKPYGESNGGEAGAFVVDNVVVTIA